MYPIGHSAVCFSLTKVKVLKVTFNWLLMSLDYIFIGRYKNVFIFDLASLGPATASLSIF